MKKRFIVCVDMPMKEEDNAFLDYVKSKGLGWWHWINGVWLLVDSNGKSTASEIRDATGKHFNNRNRLVIELDKDGDTWSGHGPKSQDNDMFDWIHRNWHS